MRRGLMLLQLIFTTEAAHGKFTVVIVATVPRFLRRIVFGHAVPLEVFLREESDLAQFALVWSLVFGFVDLDVFAIV